ncbi:hypothetical protein LLG46_03590 [bacterium]|nr:hypothetical protein [bacterium]
MKIISSMLVLVLLLIATPQCGAESLQVTTTQVSTQTKRGVPVVMAVNLKNVLAPRDPITLTAEAQWEDEYGVTKTTTASTTITVIQPIKVNTYKVAIPALFDFVAGSAKIDGQPVTSTLDSGTIMFQIGRTLLEGQSVSLEYAVKAQ